ncbi:hypothetical protein AKJ09_01063 [Labilithrix luteola]|uniref:Peptidase C14 caspase domain-containing protein n=1 Tax=Labilithrix luteola TaxID=1391654 RepID=A0A0K1PMR1_9BACT|nr:caspase family protein [Labilithrix luteola]AKU94399.1 hypothetical protein AKJ09_01063 [Labilithrix luteola]
MKSRTKRAFVRSLALAFGLAVLPLSSSWAQSRTEPDPRSGPRVSAPSTSASATFALVIGSNQSVDSELAPLKYADDDAARYFDLFRLLGARTTLLTRLDENTRRLHSQAAAEAEEPRIANLERAVAQLSAAVAQARSRSLETTVYIVYAGHGNVRDGEGYITLEDGRITGAALARIVSGINATRVHLVVDACASYLVAYSRGPGGQRRPLEEFRVRSLEDDPRVGMLLSTSSARESHEWEAFQSGVFSHEVRSGLYGAADMNGDGIVTYREIGAFVARANAAVPNERYRPDIHARPPKDSEVFVDIRRALSRRVLIDGSHAGHYVLEDADGIRLADLNNAAGQDVVLVRPDRTLFLRRPEDEAEYELEPARPQVALAELSPRAPLVRMRGAAHEAFARLFALPFDSRAVDEFALAPAAPLRDDGPATPNTPWSPRRTLGVVALGVGAVGLGLGTYFALDAHGVATRAPDRESNADAFERSRRVSREETAATISLVGGGAVAAAGALLLLWPQARNVQAVALPSGGYVGYSHSF